MPWNKGAASKASDETVLHAPAVDPLTDVLRLKRVWGTCPTCAQQVIAATSGGRVKGYCAVARQYVDFLIET